MREIKEETGLDVKLEGLLDVATDVHLDEAGGIQYHYVLVDYIAKARPGKVKINGESTGWKWFSRSDSERATVSENTRKAVRKYFEMSDGVAPRRGQGTRSLKH